MKKQINVENVKSVFDENNKKSLEGHKNNFLL